MRFIWKKHSRYGNYMSAEITLFKTYLNRFTIQEFYNPHYLEIRKWTRDKDIGFRVLKKWWQIPLNKESRQLFKNEPKRRKVPSNIHVISNQLKKELNKDE